jgi:AcrR family transcriptional regulator
LKSASQGQPALRQRIRETTVQAILTAAEEVFANKGLHAAHMGEIASLAGVAVGTLYNHFADRDALLAGLLEARRDELLARIDEALAAGGGNRRPIIRPNIRPNFRPSFRERLRAFLQAVLAHKEAHRRFFQILMQGEIVRYQETFPSACHVPSATMHEMFTRLDKLMKQGLREKALRADIVDLAPVLLMGMVRAVMIRDTLVKGGAGDLVSETDRLLTFFFQGAGP